MAVVSRTNQKLVTLPRKGPRPGGVPANNGKVAKDGTSRPTTTNHAANMEAPGYCWNRFVRHRHQRMDAPPMFDEGDRKFEKFGAFSFDASDPFGMSSSLEHATGSSWRSLSSSKVNFEDDEAGEDELGENVEETTKFIGLRKARFFEGCLRADKAFEMPRLPAPGPPHSARESRGRPQSRGSTGGRQSISQGGEQESSSPAHSPSGRSGSKPRSLSPQAENRRLGGPCLMQRPAPVLPPVEAVHASPGAAGASSSAASPSKPMGEEQEEPLTISRSMSGFVNSCRTAGMNPSTTGIIRADGEKLKLEYGCMTDMRAEAIIQTLRASSAEVVEAHLRSNGLTERGAKHLLSALPEGLQVIDLSQNDLGHNDGWCHGFKRLMNLRALNVSDSNLGDNISRTLCEALGGCRQLKTLNLSGNRIHHAAEAVKSLVQGSMALEELDVHWNHISDIPARALVQGLYDNGVSGAGHLHDVNISWNPLGKAGGEEVCNELKRVFRENKVIRHLDLSKCDLTTGQCQILADGLKENTTLLGIHIGGNRAFVDARGFIVPLPPALGVPIARDAPDAEKDAKTEGSGDPALKSHQADICCWVCNRWQETRILYTPGISGPELSDVWVFTSVDDFQSATKLTKCQDGLATYFVCPPGILRYVFQVGSEIITSRTASIQYDINPKIHLKRELAIGEHEEDEQGTPISLQVEVSRVNTKAVNARELDAPVCVCSVPRQPGKIENDEPDMKWKVTESLFGPYDEALERRSFCEKCFEADWKNADISSLIEDDNDCAGVKDLLRAHYAEIKVLFGSLCSVEQRLVRPSPPLPEGYIGREEVQKDTVDLPLTFGLSLNEYTHMLVQHHILGGEEMSIHDADSQFLLAAAPHRDSHTWAASTHKDGHLVLRHGFFELLVRLALMRFRRGELMPTLNAEDGTLPKQKAKTAANALDILLNKHIMYPYPPMKYNFNCVQWRVDVLHTQEVEAVLRKHAKGIIDPLFKVLSRELLPRSGRFLKVEDWFRFLDGLHVLPCDDENSIRNTWDRSWVWQISAMAHIDELSDDGHLLMSWPEFLEALARLVGLLKAREKAVEKDESEKFDYGLSFVSPSYAFCNDTEEVMDKEAFAELLDEFLGQDLLKQVIRNG